MSDVITPVTMPKFGLAMTEGKLAGWTVQPGQAVKAGDELADIETTKITNGYESPVSGVFRRQVVGEGETLPVGALIGIIADDSVPDADIDAFIAKFQSEQEVEGEEGDDNAASEPTVIEVGSLRIRIQDARKTHTDTTPLLLIHGFGGDLTNWMFNQNDLAEKRRVVAFDLPGHGESTKDVGDGTPATFAATVETLLDTLGIARAHVAGHSLGGAIALELAKRSPDKVASLSLVAPAGLGRDINMTFIDGFISADRRKTLEPVLQLLVHDKALVSRQMVEGIIRFKRLDGAVAGLTTIARACFPDGQQADDLRPVLETFDGPVQVIWGEDDEILSPESAKDLPAKVEVTILPQAGHMPQMEKSSDINGKIESFLKN